MVIPSDREDEVSSRARPRRVHNAAVVADELRRGTLLPSHPERVCANTSAWRCLTPARDPRHAAPMVDRVVPTTWTQLRSWEQLQRWRRRPGIIVILDDYTPSHFHNPDCADIREEHFETKRRNRWANGAYYWASNSAQAAGFATACVNCGGQ